MNVLTTTESMVLNATAEGAETLEEIYQRLHDASRPVSLAEAADAVRSLLESGLLVARMGRDVPPLRELNDLSCVWRARFAASPEGREALASSKPASSTPATARKSLFGAWKDIAVDVPLEDFQEARREMSRNFPREFPE